MFTSKNILERFGVQVISGGKGLSMDSMSKGWYIGISLRKILDISPGEVDLDHDIIFCLAGKKVLLARCMNLNFSVYPSMPVL